MTTMIFLSGWLCGALTALLVRYVWQPSAVHRPAAERLLTGERFPLAISRYEGDQP